MDQPTLAWLSEGKLYVKRSDADDAAQVDSYFGQEVERRREQNRERAAWKGGLWTPMAVDVPMMQQFQMAGSPDFVAFRSIAAAGGSKLLFTLDLGAVGGLFEYDVETDDERRLVHRNDFRVQDLARRGEDGDIACVVAKDDGRKHLAIGGPDGRRINELTEGDCVDEAVSWAPPPGRRVLYQSAGIARNGHGVVVAYAPYAIHTLDIDTGDMETLAQHDEHDCLHPRMSDDETLFYIRRPYQSQGHRTFNPKQLAVDIVMFPWAVLATGYALINWMSLMLRNQPLSRAGGAKPIDSMEARHIALWGRAVEVKRQQQKQGNAPAGLVPNDWVLVRRAQGGEEETLAEGVVAFDISRAGDVAYTTGTAVYLQRAGADAKPTRIASGSVVHALAWLD